MRPALPPGSTSPGPSQLPHPLLITAERCNPLGHGIYGLDIVWAFHSDAETELLSNIRCIQQDRLNWEDLRDAGIGWWIRSNDTLRRIIEKVRYIINVTTTNLNILFSEVTLHVYNTCTCCQLLILYQN